MLTRFVPAGNLFSFHLIIYLFVYFATSNSQSNAEQKLILKLAITTIEINKRLGMILQY